MIPKRIVFVLFASFISLLVLLSPLKTGAEQEAPQAPGAVNGPVGNAFTYQGRLTISGVPANGSYDFRFHLWDDDAYTHLLSTYPSSGSVTIDVVDGFFTTIIYFDVGVFDGDERWLEIEVEEKPLAPLQRISATPYAIYAQKVPWSGLNNVPAGFADGVDNDTTTFWSLTGNSGTNQTSDYVGTNDNQRLVFRVNAIPALWLEPTSGTPNIIGGSYSNNVTAGVLGASINGGGSNTYPNHVTDNYGTVGGGIGNQAGDNASAIDNRPYTTVSGGYRNTASGYISTVSGGDSNLASGYYATVGGGSINYANEDLATVGGGYFNVSSGYAATIGGGYSNTASGDYTAIAGGKSNSASGDYSMVGGGNNNTASADFATIGGGGNSSPTSGNRVTDNYGTVSGGSDNQAGDDAGGIDDHEYATVGGGDSNTSSGSSSTIGGGYYNTASGSSSTIGGGYSNTTNGSGSTISGGYTNNANGLYSTVSGGWYNIASGNYATAGGGYYNTASGSNSFAAGALANATHDGSFVWSSQESSSSWAANTFTARAHGGARFYTASGTSTGVQLAGGGGSWGSLSDRNMKHNIIPVNSLAVLEELAGLPISTWSYTSQDDSIRHMGPMSQDFYASFGLGEDERYIGTLDAEGVALAAIQGLYQVNQEQAKQVEQIKKENAQLLKENETLNAQLESLASRLDALEGGDHPQRDSLYGILIGALLIGVIGWGAPKLSRRFS